MTFFFDGTNSFLPVWKGTFLNAFPHFKFYHRVEEVVDLEEVRFLATWAPPREIGALFPKLEVVISLGAGADQLLQLDLPENVRIVRTVGNSIILMVRDYTMLGVLALHRDLPRFLTQQKAGSSEQGTVFPASRRTVGIMGLGHTALATIEALKVFGFSIRGWSRKPKAIDGVDTFFGSEGLDPFLRQSDILVCLLPLTSETTGILSAALFDKLPRGAGLIHVGRGKQLDNDALIEALHRGQLSAAFVDVTEPEPLPATHAFWSNSKIILTPHIAAQTDSLEAALTAVQTIKDYLNGNAIVGLIDRAVGY